MINLFIDQEIELAHRELTWPWLNRFCPWFMSPHNIVFLPFVIFSQKCPLNGVEWKRHKTLTRDDFPHVLYDSLKIVMNKWRDSSGSQK